MRLSRDRECTAVTPDRIRSTYMAHSSGWSNPVWNLLATIMIWYGSPRNAVRRSRTPGFMFASVKSSGPDSGSCTAPENATRVP